MEKNGGKPLLWFTARVMVIHFITYFVLGFIAINIFNYHYWYSVPPLNNYMLPTTHPQVTMGPLLNLIRGIVFGLVLYPFRIIFLKQKYGWLYLWGLLFGLGILNPFGPAPGSIEGLIYTIIPFWLQIAFLPETIIQSLLLAVLIYVWQRNPDDKRIWVPILIIFFILLALAILAVVFTPFVP